MEKLVAPPYDVVNRKERDAFVESAPLNIFSLELPDSHACDGNVDMYECSRRLLETWKRENILAFDDKPCLYPYELEFNLPEREDAGRYIRRGVIAAVRTEEWSERVVLPHEKTFDKVTGDRLRLLESTSTQFSPIFMLYRHNDAADRIFSFNGKEMLFSVYDSSGNRHTLYKIDDPAVTGTFCSLFAETPLYIADGHHRYTTALRYRREMAARAGRGSVEQYGYVMTYLTDVEDSGMVVLPTHRIVSAGVVDISSRRDALNEAFEIEEVDVQGLSPSVVVERLRQKLNLKSGLPAVGCLYEQCRKAELWRVRPGYEKMLEDYNRKPELACLDVVVLNDIVFRQLGIDPHDLETGKDIRYEAETLKGATGLGEGEIMFMMRPTPAKQVLDVADAGLVMPHKSTFFYPKILSGLVMNDMNG